jgi:hypothetical protein
MFTIRIDVYRFSYILSPPDSRLQCTFRLWCVSYHSKQLANLNKQYYKLHVQKVTSVYIAHFCLVNNFTLVFFSWVCLFIFLLHHVYMNLFCFLYMHCNIQWCIFSCQIWGKNSIVICLHLVKVRIWTVRTFIHVWRTYILVIYETGNKL